MTTIKRTAIFLALLLSFSILDAVARKPEPLSNVSTKLETSFGILKPYWHVSNQNNQAVMTVPASDIELFKTVLLPIFSNVGLFPVTLDQNRWVFEDQQAFMPFGMSVAMSMFSKHNGYYQHKVYIYLIPINDTVNVTMKGETIISPATPLQTVTEDKDIQSKLNVLNEISTTVLMRVKQEPTLPPQAEPKVVDSGK